MMLFAALPAAAQQPPAPTVHQRSIAAGYKALMLCGAMFNGGRTQAQAQALELTGIYPEYDAIVPALKAQVDRDRGTVSVAYDAKMPPRLAEWGVNSGCTIFPPGAVELPRIGDVQPLGYRPAADFRKPDRRLWPLGDALPRIAPDARVTPLAQAAFTPRYGEKARTVSVLIMQDGRLLAERYADGFDAFTANRTWSVAKSITGTLLGIAAKQGLAHPAAPANIPEWGAWPRGDRRRTITLDNLLRMASGLHSDTAGNRTDAVYFGGTRVTEETVAWPLEVLPGTRFRYANNDSLLVMRSLRASLGEDRYRWFPLVELFRPLGMRHTVAEQDAGGNYILSSQVWSTARDFARLGQFWLQDGAWDGKRLLPEGWMRHMTTPSGPQPASGPGYGASLWLFGPKQGLPAGSYAAQGNRGQYIMVVPSAKLVVVRRGEDPGGGFDIAAFTADVLKALDGSRR
ncbi:beta-lactamase family protein [Sphingomonas sp. MG17]|uniref:Beta-lactamase family protein n=1 Tax=Sphingomonas tagetis TaxID=2949092 RepID=A0A9X2HTD3_9SPHN|nr:serine hydrolase [Sphingomonas tagetis]MCP3733143.1 beta-lactamase family protein [Sphingomonas tagetis]